MTNPNPVGSISNRSLALALVSGLCAMGLSSGAMADPEIVTESSGSYGPAIFPSGSPETQCNIPDNVQALSPMVQTFHFINKICDDRQSDGLPACGSRYTAYIEECSRPAADEYTNGSVVSRKSSGLYRICYNDETVTPGAPTDCRDTPAGVTVIAWGTTQTHSTHVSGTQLQGGTSDLKMTDDVKFYPDSTGKYKRWSKSTGKRLIIHSTGQISGPLGGCGPASDQGCGIASTGVGK